MDEGTGESKAVLAEWPGGKTGKDAGRMVALREGRGAVVDGFLSEEGLLADA